MNEAAANIILSAVTLIVVAAASAAAIVQLRYLRASNQLNGLLEILNQWNLPAVQSALAELRSVEKKMEDPRYVAVLRTPDAIDRAEHLEFIALDLWEQVGTYSKYGLIDEAILLDVVSAQVAAAWKRSEKAIALVREHAGSSAFENFEYLAVRAALWQQRYPNGTYPARLPRMRDLEERDGGR